ncbi:FAD-binding oxidoreductase [Streptomyces sp. NPDC021224]|uniref:FAD-binding oxidoreductase n=1 Tax=unclassified Streptomyces TaxID=2593676 RepID=UPI0037BC929F
MTAAVGTDRDFSGALLVPGSPQYEAARQVWNGMIDRRPAAVARCRDAADVSAALRYADRAGLAVTVRGGGHNVAGTAVADGALMIDLSPMNDVVVDPAAALVRAGGGCLLRDVDRATTRYGLACPAGVVSHTGLGGLALGGGYGWLARTWGLTCDHLVAAEVVLADGTVVEADDDSHPELLWALRGGGGNFGVVTRFTLALRPVGPVYFRRAVYELSEAVPVLAAYQAFAEQQSDDVHAVGSIHHVTANDWVPAALAGRPALFLSVACFGDPAEGPESTDGLFEAVEPVAGTVGLLDYRTLQSLGDTSEPHGNRYYTKSGYLTEVSGAAAELALAGADMCSQASSVDFEFLRGAIARPSGAERSAFPNREAPYICTASAQWTDPAQDAPNAAWARRTLDRLVPWNHGGVYVNYLQDAESSDAGVSRVVGAYGAPRYRRLAEAKSRYDPGNRFRSNQNVRPSR